MRNREKLLDRQNNYDLLRLLSTFAVILIHVNATIANQNNMSLIGLNFYSFVNVITRFSVPSFVMLSGAFILNNERNTDYKYFYLKSFYKIGIPFIIFSIVCVLFSELSSISSGNEFFAPIESLLRGDIDNYWFMFMLVGIYFLAPIIIRVKKSVSNKCFCVGSFIWLAFAIISQSTSTYGVSYSFGVVFSFLGFFLVGNVIYENIAGKRSPVKYIILSLICFFGVFILRVATKYSYFTVNPFSSWFSPLILIGSILLFIGFSNINIKINLRKFSSYTYLIYLFHTKIYLLLIKIFDRVLPSIRLCSEIYVLVVAVLALFVSLGCAIIYSKIWSFLENRYGWKNQYIKIVQEKD